MLAPSDQLSRSRTPISAVLVSYNTEALTCRAIAALKEQLDLSRDEMIVVDNASSDGTADRLKKDHPDVRLIVNPNNNGFGAANNLGMADATGEYFLLINTDAFVESDAVDRLASYLDRHGTCGVVGPRLLNEDRSLQASCFAFPTVRQAWREALALHYLLPGVERWAHDVEREVDFVSGACLMVRKAVFESVGGFDERFFMYSEETDWQRRIRDAGWSVKFSPDAQVVHLGGASHKSSQTHPEFFVSIDKYQLKHGGWWGLVAFRAAMVAGLLLRLPFRVLTALRGDRSSLQQSVSLLYRQALTWPSWGPEKASP